MREPAVGYYRVSTDKQAQEGFSLDGQRAAVRRYVAEHGLELISEHAEAESGFRPSKISLAKRPGLRNALRDCKRYRALLVIAALNRLVRNVVFIASLVETRVPFVALDIPNATPFMIHIHAAVAEEESRQKGRLIRAAQVLAKARGKRWDQWGRLQAKEADERAEAIRPIIDEMRAAGIVGIYRLTKELNRRNVARAAGKTWNISLVTEVLKRLGYYEKAVKPWCEINHGIAVARAEVLRPVVAELERCGVRRSRDIAAALNERGLTTPRGLQWTRKGIDGFRKRYFEETRLAEPAHDQNLETLSHPTGNRVTLLGRLAIGGCAGSSKN